MLTVEEFRKIREDRENQFREMISKTVDDLEPVIDEKLKEGEFRFWISVDIEKRHHKNVAYEIKYRYEQNGWKVEYCGTGDEVIEVEFSF